MDAEPLSLMDIRDVAAVAEQVVACFSHAFAGSLSDAEVHHIGATSLPFGHTKGDVDVNVRIDEARFDTVVKALRDGLVVAQPENWTATFASFSSDRYRLPLGVQVTVIGSADDFLLALRDRMRSEPELLRRYNEIKVAAANQGAGAYWEAKNRLLQGLVSEETASRR